MNLPINTIYKFEFKIDDTFQIDLPAKCRILDVQLQNGKYCMWVLHNTYEAYHTRYFKIFGTGHQMPDDLSKHLYIKTIQDSHFVWHIFEILK